MKAVETEKKEETETEEIAGSSKGKGEEIDESEALSLYAKGNRNLHCGEVATAVTQLEEASRLL